MKILNGSIIFAVNKFVLFLFSFLSFFIYFVYCICCHYENRIASLEKAQVLFLLKVEEKLRENAALLASKKHENFLGIPDEYVVFGIGIFALAVLFYLGSHYGGPSSPGPGSGSDSVTQLTPDAVIDAISDSVTQLTPDMMNQALSDFRSERRVTYVDQIVSRDGVEHRFVAETFTDGLSNVYTISKQLDDNGVITGLLFTPANPFTQPIMPISDFLCCNLFLLEICGCHLPSQPDIVAANEAVVRYIEALLRLNG